MALRPLHDRILVQRIEEEEQKAQERQRSEEAHCSNFPRRSMCTTVS